MPSAWGSSGYFQLIPVGHKAAFEAGWLHRKTTQPEREYYEEKKGICAPEIRTERQAPCRSPKKKLGPITVRNSLNTMQNADSACKTELDESKTYSIGAGLRNQRPGVRIAPGALFISV